jgi:hypothetical protein
MPDPHNLHPEVIKRLKSLLDQTFDAVMTLDKLKMQIQKQNEDWSEHNDLIIDTIHQVYIDLDNLYKPILFEAYEKKLS